MPSHREVDKSSVSHTAIRDQGAVIIATYTDVSILLTYALGQSSDVLPQLYVITGITGCNTTLYKFIRKMYLFKKVC